MYGRGQGKVALFLHGADLDRGASFFESAFASFEAAGYAVLAFDYPGHGDSKVGSPLQRRSASSGVLTVARSLQALPGESAYGRAVAQEKMSPSTLSSGASILGSRSHARNASTGTPLL